MKIFCQTFFIRREIRAKEAAEAEKKALDANKPKKKKKKSEVKKVLQTFF